MKTVSGLRLYNIHIPERWIKLLQELVDQGFYPNRAEAIRTAIRELLQQHMHSKRKRDPPKTRYQVVYYKNGVEKVIPVDNLEIAMRTARAKSFRGYAVVLDHAGRLVKEFSNYRELRW